MASGKGSQKNSKKRCRGKNFSGRKGPGETAPGKGCGSLKGKDVLVRELESSEDGLGEKEAKERLNKYGRNELKKKRDFTVLRLVAGQFTSFLVLVLVAAGIISFAIGEALDAAGIFAIVIINGIIGFAQEFKAENAVKALRKMVTEEAVVIRDGKREKIDARFLVPGDVVVIEEGMKVPADMRILEGFSIKANEAMLTGESLSSKKRAVEKPTEKNFREGMLYSNTLVVSGSGKGIVTATGMSTEFGKIAELVMAREKEETLLKKQMNVLAKKIGIIIIALIAVIFVLGLFRGINIVHMFNTAVSLGVSAIPEGLPIIVTLTLALGVQTIARRRAIVRKMSVIESLGAATVICSDKTGTLTMNEMTVKRVFAGGKDESVGGVGYAAKKTGRKGLGLDTEEGKKLLEVALNCNNSYIEFTKAGIASKTIGDPTELALKVLAKKAGGISRFEKLGEEAFTSKRKMMSTLHKTKSGKEIFMKGAPEEVLKACTHIMEGGKKKKLTRASKKKLLEKNEEWASDALRVLAFAYRSAEGKKIEEKEMVFLGLAGMIDPPRKEVSEAFKTAQDAGINVKIITGDNPLTTKAIVESIGLEPGTVHEGRELDSMDDSKLRQVLKKGTIFARTSPKHKHRIVSLLQESGEVVAVTGDGVNDAPALKKADIGVAMGIKGTEVSKGASDIILQDDNFATIINIIEEGRRVYSNILSFVKFLLSANAGEIAIVGLFLIAGAPLPLLPLQILWINIATDSLPALALGSEKAEKGVMEKKPHKKGEGLIKKFALFIGLTTLIQVITNAVLFLYGIAEDTALGINTFDISAESHARTLLFTGMVVFQLFLVFNCRGKSKSILRGGLFKNKKLVLAVLASFAMQLAIIYHPFMNLVFKTVPLSPAEWAMIALLSSPALLIPQMAGFFRKRLNKNKAI